MLSREEKKAPESFAYNDFIEVNGRPVSCLRECNDATLAFFEGMGVHSVEDVVGVNTISYAAKLTTMSEEARKNWLEWQLSIHAKVKANNLYRETDRTVLLPSGKIFVWDQEARPVVKEKKVVGQVLRDTFSDKLYTAEEVLDLYVKAYGDGEMGSKAFARDHDLYSILSEKICSNPNMLKLFLADGSMEGGRMRKKGLGYTLSTLYTYSNDIKTSLREHGVSRAKAHEFVMERYKKEVWRTKPPSLS